MNRNEIIKLILKKKIYIIAITVIFAVTGICYNLANVKCVATQKILIGATQNEEVLETSKEIITGSTVLDEVIKNANLNMSSQKLLEKMEVNHISNTDMIEIKVFGDNLEEPQKILNEISKVFKKTIDSIYGNAEIYNVDQSCNYYKSYNIIFVGLLSAMVGFLLAVLIFVSAFLLDNKIKSCKDIEDITGLKTLMTIPAVKKTTKKKKNKKNVRRPKNEVFKTLMTNIQFLNINNLKSKSILITSSNSLDGKTYVANNLAIEFAKAGKKVILIDSNMTKGKIAKIFNIPNDLGFSNYLSNLDSNGNNINDRITRFINDTEIKNLNIITSGNIPPNPVELLRTNKIKQLIKDLKVFYDIIIFDSVSVLDGPEANILTKACDLTLILSSYKKTKKNELFAVYEKMRNVDDSVISMVLNKVPERKKLVSFKNQVKQITKKIKSRIKGIIGVFEKNKKVIISRFTNLRINIKGKTQNVKEYIKKCKNRKSGIKLIEAAKEEQEDKENIIKDVFENKMSKTEKEELEPQNIQKVPEKKIEKIPEIKSPKVEIAINKKEEKIESKIEPKIAKKVENEEKEEQEKVNVKPKQKIVYEMIDFRIPENLTEENIRKQVEMDEMIRLAELEEKEETLKIKQEKYKEKVKRKKEIQEKFLNFKENVRIDFQNILDKTKTKIVEKQAVLKEKHEKYNELKLEEKSRREAIKAEIKEKQAKEKEEKRAHKESKKRKQKEELRIKEELQEDNLYPKPRM